MGKLLKTICLTAFFSGAIPAFSQIKFNTDTKTIQAVTETMAAQTAVESIHNIELDSVRSKKQKIAGYAKKMMVIKEMYRIAMQNIDGFGQETRLYKAVALTAAEIMTKIPVALNELRKRPYQMINCYKDMAELSMEATSAVNTFINVVNNGKISIKVKDMQMEGASDGYNFLNRTDRYVVANSVLTSLREIKYKLDGIIYITRFCNSISDILYTIDAETWCNVVGAANQVKTIIRLYQDL